MPYLIAIRSFLGKLPWQLYAALGAILLLFATYHKGRHDGKQVMIARLEEAERVAKEKAAKAIVKADANQAEEAAKFEAQQEVLRGAIEQAEQDGGNALDSIF